jgi:hypothetical protein
MTQKHQLLNICLISKVRDFNGIWEVSILLNGKAYTYPITSEFAVRKFESLLYRHKPGRALEILRKFKITGFNSFEKEESKCSTINSAEI